MNPQQALIVLLSLQRRMLLTMRCMMSMESPYRARSPEVSTGSLRAMPAPLRSVSVIVKLLCHVCCS